MIKKALIAIASVALSAPAFAGSIGTLQSTNTINTIGGSRAVTINGTYTAEEQNVNASTDGTGASASATWDPVTGPALTTGGTGGASANSASATYATNNVRAATYLNDVQSSFNGSETVTLNGVFFNY